MFYPAFVLDPASRVVRIFISSTFRDFQEERRLLVSEVFPELRSRARERFVDVVEVDLRWGITQEEAERGEALPICLREILRARPYFVGMLGDRYGWVPAPNQVPALAVDEHPWLREHLGAASVTELEILCGVLNDPASASRALFYFRDSRYSEGKGADFRSNDHDALQRLARLKSAIERSGLPVAKDYATPTAFAERVLQDLWRQIEADYPAEAIPSPDERERRMHSIWASHQRRAFVGREDRLRELSDLVEQFSATADELGTPPVSVTGRTGIGKSALLAEWVRRHVDRCPDDFLFEHYGQTSFGRGTAGWVLGRLKAWVKTVSGTEQPPDPELGPVELDETDALSDAPLDDVLAELSRLALQAGRRAVVVLDGLEVEQDGRWGWWLPTRVPAGVVLIVAPAGDGSEEIAVLRGARMIRIDALNQAERSALIAQSLASHLKRLSRDHISQIAGAAIADKPDTLQWIVEEMLRAASHDDLDLWVNTIVECETESGWIESVLDRLESDLPEGAAGRMLVSIALASTGIHENDLADIANVSSRSVTQLRFRLGSVIEAGDCHLCIHRSDFREAVRERWLPTDAQLRQRAIADADWWLHRLENGWVAPQQAVPEACILLLRASELTKLCEVIGMPHVLWQVGVLTRELRSRVAAAANAGGECLENMLSGVLRGQLDAFCSGREGALRVCAVSDMLAHARLFGAFHEHMLDVALQRAVAAGDDAATPGLRNARASLLEANGRWDEACAEYLAVLQFRQTDSDWPQIDDLIVLSNLAGALMAAGRPSEALDCAESAVRLARSRRGIAARILEGILLNSRATLLRRRGNLDEALASSRQAVLLLERYAGRNASSYLVCAGNLAVNLRGLQQHSEAEQMLLANMERVRSTFGDRSAQRGRQLALLGSVIAAQRRPREGLAMIQDAIEVLRDAPGAEEVMAAAISYSASALIEVGQLDDAITAMGELVAQPDWLRWHGNDVEERVCHDLARACAHAERWGESAQWWMRIFHLLGGSSDADKVSIERAIQLLMLVINAIVSRQQGGLAYCDLLKQGNPWSARLERVLAGSGPGDGELKLICDRYREFAKSACS